MIQKILNETMAMVQRVIFDNHDKIDKKMKKRYNLIFLTEVNKLVQIPLKSQIFKETS